MKYHVPIVVIVIVSLMALNSASAADAAAGEKVYRKCKACHAIDKGGRHKVGPILFSIMGRKAGTVEGFRFSRAMKKAGITWDAATLRKFLANPKRVVKGTRMAFAGIRKDKDLDDIIAYIETTSRSRTPGK